MKAWRVWLVFALCVTVVGGVLGWFSLTVLRLDHDQRKNREFGGLESRARLALHRMDAALIPLIVEESKRPYFEYLATYAADRAYARVFRARARDEVLVPSPLLLAAPPFTRLHFQIHADYRISSPQVPDAEHLAALAGEVQLDPDRLARARDELARLQEILQRENRLRQLVFAASTRELAAATHASGAERDSEAMANRREYDVRRQNVVEAQRSANQAEAPSATVREVNVEEFRPVWLDHELMFLRRVVAGGEVYTQGVWIDWPALARDLLARSEDLLPEARLKPMAEVEAGDRQHQLAALPAVLIPGRLPGMPPWERFTPLRISLLIAVGSALISALAVLFLIRIMLAFNERRAAFVSAVTHELRTPLTTLRLYTDLLCQGKVQDEGKRARYLETMRREAERLAHLVENVLTFSRVEAGRRPSRREVVSVGDLLARSLERSRERARGAGMELVVAPLDGAASGRVSVDSGAVEQILFNLVDNACKYAGQGGDRRIELDAVPNGSSVDVRVRDHGPGVRADDARRIFTPFARGRDAPAGQGVGLGLALCRRLARDMGGDLLLDPAASGARGVHGAPDAPGRIESANGGARFALRLPLA